MALGPELLFSAAAIVAAATAPTGPETLVAALDVNGVKRPEPVIVQREGEDFYVPAAVLAELGVLLEGVRRSTLGGVEHVRIRDIAGAGASFDAAEQRLRLTLPAGAFQRKVLSYGSSDPGPMTPSGRGMFLNYELIGTTGGGETGLGGAFELGLFSGPAFASTTGLVRMDRDGRKFVRLDSSWSRDDVDGMTTLRIGDSISRGGAGTAPVRFGGIQYGRSFALRPGFITMPVPRLGGEAAVPSVVDLYVNGILAGSRTVQPGAFEVGEVPIVSGDGTVSAIVRDAAGRETMVSESYYAAPALLREGLSDFGYEAGFLRQGYGRRGFSYGAAFASATHRRGVTDRLTVEGHAAATADVQQAGAAADWALPGIGLLGVTFGGSRSREGVGVAAQVRGEHRSDFFSLSGSASYTSPDFVGIGERRDRRGATATVQIFGGVPLSFGSLSLGYFLRDEEGEERDVEHLGLRGAFPIARLGTLRLSARRSFAQDRELAIEASLSVRLGEETSASAQLRQRGGRTDGYALVQRPMPFGEGWGYRARAGFGPNGPGFGAWLTMNGAYGEYGAEVADHGSGLAARVSAAGSVGILGGETFAARRLTQSFAMVSVDGQENVRVYADNHLVGRTDGSGRAIVPRLRPYERNTLRLDFADLPLDASVGEALQEVRPYARGGVAARFSAQRSKSGIVRIEIEGEGPLPAGSVVLLRGREFLTAPGGQVYLEGLEGANDLEVRWPAGACTLSLAVAETDDPQPDLGTRTCTRRAA